MALARDQRGPSLFYAKQVGPCFNDCSSPRHCCWFSLRSAVVSPFVRVRTVVDAHSILCWAAMSIATVATRSVAAMVVATRKLVPQKTVPGVAQARLAAFALSAVAVAIAC